MPLSRKLIVSQNKRYLCYEDRTPFFYLADTAWELFHRLTLNEADFYLENRRKKKFNVIQAVILAEEDGLHTPNANGDVPLLNNNPLTPNEAYFRHVDAIIKLAGEKGLFIGLLPTWGDKVILKNHGKGPVIFNSDNAFLYGRWMGNRYGNLPNIIWINGGDRLVDEETHRIWDALGKGIKSADSNHLMTFHPPGGDGGHSSSEWFHACDWLDFNILQSGHESRELKNYTLLERDYNLKPLKPCLDAEPRYEDHAINWKPENGWFDDLDVRRAAYWAVFSGACGHTYGCQPIWQMYDIGRNPVSFVRRTWKEALDLPGSGQMQHLRNIVSEADYTTLKPAQHLLKQDFPDVRILAREDTIVIYFPEQATIGLNIPAWKAAKQEWFNPKTGLKKAGEVVSGKSNLQLTSPYDNDDYVLILRKHI